ncbi:hypothetical protein MMC28_008575 [Mycoblastus sanguinarius]|nr:hypothetical protein [Mycoblastus sanguinarius]
MASSVIVGNVISLYSLESRIESLKDDQNRSSEAQLEIPPIINFPSPNVPVEAQHRSNAISKAEGLFDMIEEPPPPITYKLEYLDQKSNVIFTKESKERNIVQSSLGASEKSVLEVITKVRTAGSYDDGVVDSEPGSILKIEDTSLKINSPAFVTALQSVIEYYPGQPFLEDTITVPEPYSVLVHHETQLREYRDQYSPSNVVPGDKLCERERDTYQHLGILQ